MASCAGGARRAGGDTQQGAESGRRLARAMTRALGAVLAVLALAHQAAAFAPTDDNLKSSIDGCLADPPTGDNCATMGDWDTCGPASPDREPIAPAAPAASAPAAIAPAARWLLSAA